MGDVLKLSDPESSLASLDISGIGLKGFQLDFSSEKNSWLFMVGFEI